MKPRLQHVFEILEERLILRGVLDVYEQAHILFSLSLLLMHPDAVKTLWHETDRPKARHEFTVCN